MSRKNLLKFNKMEELTRLVQLTIAISVAYVWVFRFHNVVDEFKKFELSDVTRNFVGVSKISIATLLVVGIWYSSLVFIPSIAMGLFMIAAQYFHFKARNPFIKHLPSLILLLLCVFLVLESI
jgi:tellurite resistance protein TehA-like permease|tara:strand:+ start:3610 stop:3978 length:369 start_codon:yes stop_codon:yes gene_type:complete